MNSIWTISISFCYLLLLFGIAYWVERKSVKGKRISSNPYIYAFSLAVYCTAWTFYGSIGRAAQTGIDFLAIYIGPTLMAPLWWLLLRKMIRISKAQGITSLADFISSRYGKNISLGGIVTALCIAGVIPYISLQIKAIATSLDFLIGDHSVEQLAKNPVWTNTAFYVTAVLAIFIIIFSTRKIDTTERHEGLVTAIAFESIVKLFAFLCGGFFIAYVMFDGLGDIFTQTVKDPKLKTLFTLPLQYGYAEWFTLIILSMFAILLLPRQFQVGVVENVDEKHLNKAIWLFPLYLLLINVLVLPIAMAGQLTLGNISNPDFSILALPLSVHNHWLALLIYIGGFSAATGMIIVETIALSTMLSNNILIPFMVAVPPFKRFFIRRISPTITTIRRISILIILALSYGYFVYFSEGYSLVSIGLISFAAVSQLAPAVIGGMYWKNGNKTGALIGILVGFAVWFYTLVVPSIVSSGLLPETIMTEGLFGIAALKPYALFGMQNLDYLTQSFFWSMLFNVSAYLFFSLYAKTAKEEENQAELFVNVYKYAKSYESSVVWKSTTKVKDVRLLLVRFLGAHGTKKLLDKLSKTYGFRLADEDQADSRLIVHVERILSGLIGSASARILVSSIVRENDIGISEMVEVIKESQQLISLNKELRLRTDELKKASDALEKANKQLIKADELRDEFLYTITHELRTPLTSIRAFSEIMHDHPDIEPEKRQEFLHTMIKEIERLSRLISQVLNLEKLESGNYPLRWQVLQPAALLEAALAPFCQVMEDKKIKLKLDVTADLPEIRADEDLLIQVLTNLIANAIKYADAVRPELSISLDEKNDVLVWKVIDNGFGIDPEEHKLVFDKYYQVTHAKMKAQVGSGLGLAICKKIIDIHNGKIYVENSPSKGAEFTFTIPLNLA